MICLFSKVRSCRFCGLLQSKCRLSVSNSTKDWPFWKRYSESKQIFFLCTYSGHLWSQRPRTPTTFALSRGHTCSCRSNSECFRRSLRALLFQERSQDLWRKEFCPKNFISQPQFISLMGLNSADFRFLKLHQRGSLLNCRQSWFQGLFTQRASNCWNLLQMDWLLFLVKDFVHLACQILCFFLKPCLLKFSIIKVLTEDYQSDSLQKS